MSFFPTASEGPLFRSRTRRALRLASVLLFTSSAANAAVFVVNSNMDIGDISNGNGTCSTGNVIFVSSPPLVTEVECTLRAAIEEANANPGLDTIEFSSLLPTDAGFVEFTPATGYPDITDSVVIDGYSHPSYDDLDPAATPVVNIRAPLAPDPPGLTNGLTFLPGSDNSVVNGLSISRFSSVGISIEGSPTTGPENVRLQGNHIGMWRGINVSGNRRHGVAIAGNKCIVGRICGQFTGCTGKGNLISGNGGEGIRINSGDEHRIAGNYIGVNSSGTSASDSSGIATANLGNGIFVSGFSSGNFIGGVGTQFTTGTGFETITAGNLISGNGVSGIRILGPGNTVIANQIGTNAAGTSALGNLGSGIVVYFADETVIGGAGAGSNLISGNYSGGITVAGNFDGGAPYGVSVFNNRIGVNTTADAPLGNGINGLSLRGSDHKIENNIISSSGGIGIIDRSANSATIGNYIGTNENGDNLGNGDAGVVLLGSNQTVGAAGAGNIIGFNAVGIRGGSTSRDSRIYANFIGTNPAGDNLENLDDGIRIEGSGWEVGIIDARILGLANTIGFNNGNGVTDVGTATSIQGNYIGTNESGRILGNDGAGIASESLPGSSAAIGATLATFGENVNEAGNIIAYNSQGIIVDDTNGVAVRGNQLFSNEGRGIDLGNDGPTANDPGDADTGANELQNTPVFDTTQTLYNPGSGDLQIRFAVDADPANAAYPLTIDFYIHDPWLDAWDQAAAHLGSVSYNALDAGSLVTANLTPTTGTLIPNKFGDVFGGLRATATDASGNTSELSVQDVPVPEPSGGVLLASGICGLTALSFRRRNHAYQPTPKTTSNDAL